MNSPILRFVRICAAGLLAAAGILPAIVAQETPPPEPVLELPKLTVKDQAPLPELEAWKFTRVGGFEVLSNASTRSTQRLLADFNLFQQAVRLVWPAPMKPLAASSLILCGKDRKFDAFRPAANRSADVIVPSLFFRNREQIAILVDLELTQAGIIDPTAVLNTGANTVEYEVDHYRQLYREYVLYLLSQREARTPAWLEEGLAQIVMDIDLTSKTLVLGKIETHRGESSGGNPLAGDDTTDATVANAVVGEQPFNTVLQHRPLVPLGQFFAIGHDAPEARNPLGNNVWAKQAYAFVHYCMFGEKLQYKDALAKFVGRLAHEEPSEKLFQECFGVSYTEMEKQLRGYILYTKHKYQKYDLKDTERLEPDSIALAEATAGQIGIMKGDAFRLGGQPEAALAEYRAAYQRGAREPALLAGLGATVPDEAMSRRFISEAARANVARPSVYVTLAQQRLGEARTAAGPGGKLTTQEVGAILTPLFKARSFPPPLPEVYELIAATWEISSVPAKPEHLGVLDEGVRQFPRNSELLYRTARLYQAAGVPATARSIADLGVRFATDPAAKARLTELANSLPPPAK